MNLFDHLYHGCHLYLVWYNRFGVFSGCAVSNLEVTFFKFWQNKILKNMATNYIVLGSFCAIFCAGQRKTGYTCLKRFEKVTELPKMCFANCTGFYFNLPTQHGR